MTQPPVPYFGGKQKIAHRIVAMFPNHSHYVEPFCGGLSILMAKKPCRIETVNDIDERLMTFWRVLRDNPEGLLRAVTLTPHSRSEYAHAIDVERGDKPAPVDDIERARQVFVILTQGRGSRTSRNQWRTYVNPNGASIGMPGYLRGYASRILPAAERLQNVTLECQPAADIITRYGRHPDVLLYCDPPYLRSARNSYGYRHEVLHEGEHRALADTLRSVAASVVISGYPSPLYEEIYADWDRAELRTNNRQHRGGSVSRSRGRTGLSRGQRRSTSTSIPRPRHDHLFAPHHRREDR